MLGLIILPVQASAQTTDGTPSSSLSARLMLSGAALAAASLSANGSSREENCLRTARWIGAGIGVGIGLLHTYWSIAYPPHVGIPLWKQLAVGLPSAVISGVVGYHMTGWATRRIMAGSPGRAKAALKGALYGFLTGAAILTTNAVPFFLGSYYLKTLHFNFEGGHIPLKILGTSVLGGIAYGGTVGALAGIVYGPCVSLYMKF
ncbi:MAG TPA: hypothetical protein ENJ23_01650 [Bacteroidetes bacterium]|nr:hypothetical protein [Bacteroidota bacterium]